jgi:hypothetical protein
VGALDEEESECDTAGVSWGAASIVECEEVCSTGFIISADAKAVPFSAAGGTDATAERTAAPAAYHPSVFGFLLRSMQWYDLERMGPVVDVLV